MSTSTLIQLFAKPPLVGKVKTRLIPQLGEQCATAIYRYCLQSNLNMLQQSEKNFEVWLTQDSKLDLFKGLNKQIQQGENLGQRMFHALSCGLQTRIGKQDKKVILMGSDCIEITPQILSRVEHQLYDNDLVIIPAMDGGYVLIAAKNTIDPRLFINIDWSTERVLEQTLQIAKDLSIANTVLHPLRDIDRVEDVMHYPQFEPFLKPSTATE